MKHFIGIYITIVLLLASCAGEEPEAVQAGEGARTLTLTYAIPDPVVGTRAENDYVESYEHENYVNDLTLLFFRPDPHGNGTFVDYVYKELAGDAGAINSLKINTLEIPLAGTAIQEDQTYDILAVANLHILFGAKFGYDENLFKQYVTSFPTYGQAWEELEAYLFVQPYPDGHSYYYMNGTISMSGTTVKPAGANQMHIDLLRSLARIDVKVDDPNAGSSDSSMKITLKQAQLRNVAPIAPYFRTQEVITLPRISSEYVSPDPAGSNLIRSQLYAVETSLDVSDSRVLLYDATCLLINVSRPYIHTGADAAKTWYRLDLNVADNRQFLKRNNAYTVLITSVRGPGYSSADEAYFRGQSLQITGVTIPGEWKAGEQTGGPPDINIQ